MSDLPKNPSESFKRRNAHLFLMQSHQNAMPDVSEHQADEKPCAEEKEMHDQFENWLRVHSRGPIPYVHSRMDRKSTIREGWPDFTVMYGKHPEAMNVCCVEFKMPGKKLSQAQTDVFAELVQAGIPCMMCVSVIEAIEFTRAQLWL